RGYQNGNKEEAEGKPVEACRGAPEGEGHLDNAIRLRLDCCARPRGYEQFLTLLKFAVLCNLSHRRADAPLGSETASNEGEDDEGDFRCGFRSGTCGCVDGIGATAGP